VPLLANYLVKTKKKKTRKKKPLSFNNVVGHILGVIPTFDPAIGLISTCTCIRMIFFVMTR
jgi:hypothetical protein